MCVKIYFLFKNLCYWTVLRNLWKLNESEENEKKLKHNFGLDTNNSKYMYNFII